VSDGKGIRMISEMNIILSKKLKSLIRENDLTVAQLSRATRVPAQTLNNWLAGLEPRSIQQVKRVADHFGLSLDELTYGVKPKTKESSSLESNKEEILAGNFEVILRRIK
jgi:transcriptional regulator with XRE-family HTH domain